MIDRASHRELMHVGCGVLTTQMLLRPSRLSVQGLTNSGRWQSQVTIQVTLSQEHVALVIGGFTDAFTSESEARAEARRRADNGETFLAHLTELHIETPRALYILKEYTVNRADLVRQERIDVRGEEFTKMRMRFPCDGYTKRRLR